MVTIRTIPERQRKVITMGTTPGGQRDRWARLQAADQHDPLAALVNAVYGLRPDGPIDPLDAFAAAVSARTPRKRASGGTNFLAQALASYDKYTREKAAREAERERRNGPKARAAFDQWQRTRAKYSLQDEYEFDPAMSPLVAMAMHISPGAPSRIW